MLYTLLAAPLVAALVACFVSGKDSDANWRLGLFLSLIIAGIGLPLTWMADQSSSLRWFELWGTGAVVHVSLASDGLSAWLIQLVTWLTPIAILGGRGAMGTRMREFVVAVLAMEALMIGALLSRDLVVFYLCYEGMLIPMVVIIALFGGPERRTAAMWFFLYTMLGSIFMLVGIWYLAQRAGSTDLAQVIPAIARLGPGEQLALFVAFVLAFAVKVPLVPLHGWQARTYAETPGAAVVLLAGAMAKLGGYGFIRFILPMFPDQSAQYADVFIILGLIGVVGGAVVALAQDDAKRMLAYSSLSHLGLVIVGIFSFDAAALNGAAVQMVAHGLSVAALFLLVGYLENRTQTYGLDDFGGLANRTPLLAVLFVIAALASAGLPGTANFIGEFLLLLGTFKGAGLWIAAIAGLSVILGVVYLLILVQRWFYGKAQAGVERIQDLGPAEALAVVILLIGSFAFGFYPAPISSTAGSVAEKLAEPARVAQRARQSQPATTALPDPTTATEPLAASP